jgi:hypothetical protein
MIIFYTCDLRLGLQILNFVNINNQPNVERIIISLQPFEMNPSKSFHGL